MAEIIYDKRAAIRNTAFYALAFAVCLVGLIIWHSWFGRVLIALVLVWSIGGLKANFRAINHGFEDLDNPPVNQ
jgi:hypothetical protein